MTVNTKTWTRDVAALGQMTTATPTRRPRRDRSPGRVRRMTTARVEDLEESLRRIVTVIGHDPEHTCCDRDDAVLVIALDILGLDPPIRALGRDGQAVA